MEGSTARSSREFLRIRNRYRSGGDLPPPEVITRDMTQLVEVAEAAKAALERPRDGDMRRLYDAVVAVLKDGGTP